MLWFGGPILTKSTKQKIMTKSSSESEFVAINEAIPYLLETRELLKELGEPCNAPSTIFEDNSSTISFCKSGQGTSGRPKHLNTRLAYIKDQQDQGNIMLNHLPTNLMIADILTKPLARKQFSNLRDKLLNHASKD